MKLKPAIPQGLLSTAVLQTGRKAGEFASSSSAVHPGLDAENASDADSANKHDASTAHRLAYVMNLISPLRFHKHC
ncbi:MAG: hypothetical protein Q4D79_14270, partial [Propionibacteriaceae bacterium]|nr:hypothetical protein [Propionibacteriaceae bacterium]